MLQLCQQRKVNHMTVSVPDRLAGFPFNVRNASDWYKIYADMRPSRTRENWLVTVRSSVGGLTVEQAVKLADNCLQAELRGENCSTWHQSALMFGHTCNCAQCRRGPSPFKYHQVA